ncbi:MAG: DinB family protein [Bacteroidota bacterium]
MNSSRAKLHLLLDLLRESYSEKAWHGPNLRGSIRGISARQAARRPARGRHNIWEIVVHCAYWKYVVRRRTLGEKKGSFPLKGSNWFRRPLEFTDSAWKRDIALLHQCHREMMRALRTLNDASLKRTPSGSKVSNAAIIRGIASHDVYHAGQIQLIKRLIR